MHPQTRQHIAIELAAEILQRDGVMWLDTDGLSMGTALRAGDRVRLEPADPADLQPGRIVVFRTASGLIAHRILHIHDTSSGRVLQTKGDAAIAPDPPVSASRVLGVVTRIQRGQRMLDVDTCSVRVATWLQYHYARCLCALWHCAHRGQRTPHRTVHRTAAILHWPTRLLGRLLHHAAPCWRSNKSL